MVKDELVRFFSQNGSKSSSQCLHATYIYSYMYSRDWKVLILYFYFKSKNITDIDIFSNTISIINYLGIQLPYAYGYCYLLKHKLCSPNCYYNLLRHKPFIAWLVLSNTLAYMLSKTIVFIIYIGFWFLLSRPHTNQYLWSSKGHLSIVSATHLKSASTHMICSISPF